MLLITKHIQLKKTQHILELFSGALYAKAEDTLLQGLVVLLY